MQSTSEIPLTSVLPQPERGWSYFVPSALIAIVLANLIVYRNVFYGYYLADDFVHIDYLYHAVEKQFAPLLANFYGNWMQAQGTTFYRPLISVTLAVDYLLGQAGPFTFHFSNWLYQTISSCLLFVVVKKVGERFRGGSINNLLALTAALIFSVYPLHCEVVNWIIARVDSVALLFTLASFALYLKGKSPGSPLAISAHVAFIFALMSKEMAITLPPTLFMLEFLAVESGSIKVRFVAALNATYTYWAIFAAYMVFRLFALGTISGGYEGSVGQGLSSSLGRRWLDGSLLRFLFPFNIDVFGARHSLSGQLKIIYAFMAVNFTVLLFSGRKSPQIRGLLFACAWFVIALLPTYQVWNLTPTLQGGRFAYFATAPLALIFAWLLYPTAARDRADNSTRWRRGLAIVQVIAAGWFAAVLAIITTGNNEPWTHAMNEVSAFRKAVVEKVLTLRPEQNLCLIDVPHTYRGAHMLYNAATMSVLLSKPLTGEKIYQRVISFEPATFGDSDLINISRVKDKIMPSNRFYTWNRDTMQLNSVALRSEGPVSYCTTTGGTAGKVTIAGGQKAIVCGLDLNSADVDYVDVNFQNIKAASTTKADDQTVVTLSASGAGNCSFNLPVGQAENGKLRFQVSEHKQWLKLGKVNELALTAQNVSVPLAIESIACGSLTGVRPQMRCDGISLVEDGDGICRSRGAKAAFSYDASQVLGADKVYFEVSKPNSWFEHYTGTMRDHEKSAEAQYSGTLNKLKGAGIPITFSGVKGPGFFQMRLAAIDKNGKVLGYFSDPLNFQI